jgi:SPP1 gp7 family putative phage head morphogenesis protein
VDAGWVRGTLYDELDGFLADLDAMQLSAMQRMVGQYNIAFQASERQFQDLVREIEADIAAGEPFSVDRLRRMERYQQLMADTARRIDDYAGVAADETLWMQQQAVARAERDAARLMEAAATEDLAVYPTEVGRGALPPGVTMDDIRQLFHGLPAEALQGLAGMVGDGTPLHEYFLRGGATSRAPALSQAVIEQIECALTEGIATGIGSRATARAFQDAFGVGLERALTIARTETNRAYRAANQATYLENGDVISGWRWSASLGPNTCAACIAMDGTVHPLSEPMHDHPNGRCTPVPVTIFNDGRNPMRRVRREDGEYDLVETDGAGWFDTQPESVQRRVLGPAGYRAWQAGEVQLGDFVGVRTTEAFGSTVQAKSLRGILGDGAGAFYGEATSEPV